MNERSRADVPLVGQAYVVRLVWGVALITCLCDEKMPLLLQGTGAVGTCPACKRSVQVKGFAVDPVTGQLLVATASVALVAKSENTIGGN